MSDKTTQAEKALEKSQNALVQVRLRSELARASDELILSEKNLPQELAEKLAQTRVDMAQMRQLENLVNTTDKVSDILDLLKRQVGRDGHKNGWANGGVGQELIRAYENLRHTADEIANRLGNIDDLPRRVHLELCREFTRHLAAEFIYFKKRGGQ